MSSWQDFFIAYFLKGNKASRCRVLGVEVEHFILESKTQHAVAYYGDHGVREILIQLIKLYPQAQILPDEDLLGFSTPEFTITLEPAAQLEISIAPQESVFKIGMIYAHFRQKLDSILDGLGYIACNTGCQPISLVSDLKLIPKKRYTLMDTYFRHSGTGGIEMMRGTASVQVSVDYWSEEDCRRKIQASYFYTPLFKLLCDNSSSFQGKPITAHLKRSDIWRRVDSARCGILPNIFSPSYSFTDYANFLGDMPPIFLKQGSHMIPTGRQTTAQLLEGKEPTLGELSHILSMAFPDVRLKQFLEVRVTDSVPLPFMLAYCTLVNGLLYSQEGLDYAQTQIKQYNISEKSLLTAEDALMQHGWEARIYERPVQEWVKDIIALARRNIPPEEQLFLEAFSPVRKYGGINHIPAEICRKLKRQTATLLEPLV